MTSELESTSLGDSDEDDTMSRYGPAPSLPARGRASHLSAGPPPTSSACELPFPTS